LLISQKLTWEKGVCSNRLSITGNISRGLRGDQITNDYGNAAQVCSLMFVRGAQGGITIRRTRELYKKKKRESEGSDMTCRGDYDGGVLSRLPGGGGGGKKAPGAGKRVGSTVGGREGEVENDEKEKKKPKQSIKGD